MHIFGYNWVAILVAALAVQPLGAFWYSPGAFANVWLKELGRTRGGGPARPSAALFAIGFVSPLVMAAGLAKLAMAMGLDRIEQGIALGVLAAVGLVIAGTAPHYAFAGRSLRLFLIDAGHTLLVMIVLGAIVTLWR